VSRLNLREGKVSARPLICALALALGVGLLIPASAAALEHPFLETFGSANEPSFEEAQGMAVDQETGDLLVIDRKAKTLSRWHADGTPSNFSALGSNVISGVFNFGNFSSPGEVQVAVDRSGGATDGNIYVPELGGGVVTIFDEDGNLLDELTESSEGPFALPCGVGVDPSGNVYVGDLSGKIHKFENPPTDGDSVELSFADNCTLAAGAGPTNGFIFPNHINAFFSPDKSVAKLESSPPGAQKYVVDPGPVTTVTVDPVAGLLYVASDSEVKEFDVSGETEAVAGLPIQSSEGIVTGVAVDGDLRRIYVSRKGNPNVEVWGPAVQLSKVTTESASVIDGTVTMHGTINANEGLPATCVFQYVEVKVFKAKGFKGAPSEPCTPAGPFTGTTNNAVSAEVSGLAEGAYRYRLLASNADGSKAGNALVFNTFEPVPGLPDGRAYEMVSPPQKAGEVIPPEPVGQLGGSCDDCLPGANTSSMPMQSTPGGEAVLYLGQPFAADLASDPNEYLAPRTTSGWGTESLSPPTTTGAYVAFSEDLSRGVLAQGDPPLSPQAPTRSGIGFPNLYLLEDGAFEPLITSEPPNRDLSDFRLSFGGANAGTELVPPFGQVAFAANDALTEAVPGIAPAAPEVEAGKECALPGSNCNLYEWEEGELGLVNVLPGNGAVAAGAMIGTGRMLVPILQGQIPPNVDHAISEDGSRIFWSAEQTGEVYVRVEGKETLEIPGPGSCKESVPVEDRACFLTASPDGSTVLLSDGQIYELNGAGNAYVATVDLSEGEGGFEGILGGAEDLSRVYFVDTEELPGASEANENEEEAEAGKLNLYSFDEGELDFIGILSAADNGFGTRLYGAWSPSPSQRTAQVSADGEWLAFMSMASLTDYDNNLSGGGNCRSGGTACQEVFVYTAEEETLSCASCNPSGEQPLGPSNLSLIRPDGPFRQPGNLSREGNGRVFFESQDALTSRDTNGHIQDIYEWEPNGVGSCKRAGGCVYLISSGNSPNDSMFVDSSQSGNDAFFITRERLLPRDKDQQLDLYDARVGGGFEETTDAPCSPEACAGPIASPPARASFATEEVTAPGNPKPKRCKPGFVKKQGKCVKKPKKKKKQARNNRGGSK
jgi:hypothetical protein